MNSPLVLYFFYKFNNPSASLDILAREYTSNPPVFKFLRPGWNDFSITIPIPSIVAPASSINLTPPCAASPLAKKSSINNILSSLSMYFLDKVSS